MSCECAQCRQHYRTLGIAFGMPSESEIEEAYQEAVKQWHPDLYENYASLRADAEEHFKQIQVAYRELKEHNWSFCGNAGGERPCGKQLQWTEVLWTAFIPRPGASRRRRPSRLATRPAALSRRNSPSRSKR